MKAMELLPSELAHVMNNSPEELEPTLENLFIEDPDRPGIRTERIVSHQFDTNRPRY